MTTIEKKIEQPRKTIQTPRKIIQQPQKIDDAVSKDPFRAILVYGGLFSFFAIIATGLTFLMLKLKKKPPNKKPKIESLKKEVKIAKHPKSQKKRKERK